MMYRVFRRGRPDVGGVQGMCDDGAWLRGSDGTRQVYEEGMS
jgi:hypothetical protein